MALVGVELGGRRRSAGIDARAVCRWCSKMLLLTTEHELVSRQRRGRRASPEDVAILVGHHRMRTSRDVVPCPGR